MLADLINIQRTVGLEELEVFLRRLQQSGRSSLDCCTEFQIDSQQPQKSFLRVVCVNGAWTILHADVMGRPILQVVKETIERVTQHTPIDFGRYERLAALNHPGGFYANQPSSSEDIARNKIMSWHPSHGRLFDHPLDTRGTPEVVGGSYSGPRVK